MAKLAAAVFFLALAFPAAFSRPENDVIVADPVASSEPEPPRSDPGSNPLASDEINLPVNSINFHPINRHFPRRPLMATGHLNRWPYKSGQNLEIPYGRDMVMSGGGDADRWPLGVVRRIPAIHRSYEEERVRDVGKDQMDMSYGQDIVMPSGDFPEKIREEKKVTETNMDCGKVLMVRSRIYPEERLKLIKLRYNGKNDDDRDQKEYKGLFMNKIRKFLTALV